MDTQEYAALVKNDGRMTVEHLELAAGLKDRAYAFVRYMANAPQGSALHNTPGTRKVTVVARESGHVVKCLGQTFPFAEGFVWLTDSKTLGLELRVVRNEDDSEAVARLIVRPDGKALVPGRDRDFKRSIVSEEEDMDSTAIAFLEAIADTVLVGLVRRSY